MARPVGPRMNYVCADKYAVHHGWRINPRCYSRRSTQFVRFPAARRYKIEPWALAQYGAATGRFWNPLAALPEEAFIHESSPLSV
jgi:hypothetical protein